MAARDSSLGTARDVPGARGHERPGIATPAEGAARDSLWRITVPLRSLGASLVVGLGLAAASRALVHLQLDRVPTVRCRRIAIVLVAFARAAQLRTAVPTLGRRAGGAGAAAVSALTWLVIGLSLLSLPPDATSETLGVFLLFAGVSLTLPVSSTAVGMLVPAAVVGRNRRA